METSQMESRARQHVGFWKRFLAFIMDAVVLYLFGYFVFGPEITQEGTKTVTTMSYNDWRALIPILYFYLSWLFLDASPAGWVLRTKIIKTDGEKLTWGKGILRLLGTIPCFLTVGFGFLWIVFNKEKQGWHDLIAKTYVVKR